MLMSLWFPVVPRLLSRLTFGVFVVALLLLTSVAPIQAQIVTFDVANATANQTSLSPSTASGATATDLVRSGGIDDGGSYWAGDPRHFAGSDWPTFDSRDGTKYFSFTVSPNSGKALDLSSLKFALTREVYTGYVGPRKADVTYIVGGSEQDLATGLDLTNLNDADRTFYQTNFTIDLSSVPTTTETVEIRFYLYDRPYDNGTGTGSEAIGQFSNALDRTFATSNGQNRSDYEWRTAGSATRGSDVILSGSVVEANTAPTVATNRPLSLRQGSTVPIPQRLLETSDPESSAANLTYTLDTDVSNGTLLKNGSAIAVGGSFTQADVNDGAIEYQHDGTSTRSDGFDFTVSDGDGGSVSATFNIVTSPPPYGSGTTLTLDGSGDYVSTGAGGDVLGLVNESFSIGVWFRLDSSGDERTLVGMDDPETTNETLVIGEENGQFLFAFFGNDLSGGSVPTGEWVHATFVYDATRPDGENDRFIYKNGVQVAAGEASADFQGTDELLIGRNREGNYFDGQIDQVRVWEDALTKSEVRTRTRRTIDVEGSVVPELVAAWRLDAGSGTTAYDVIAGRDGTLQGDADLTSVSGAGFGQASAALQSGAQTVGPSGGSVQVENVATSGSDALQVYQYGRTSGPTLDGTVAQEDFSNTAATKRLNVVWGLEAIGSASADVTLDYSQMQGLSDPSNVRLLKRAGPGAAWQNVSDNWNWDSANQTFSKSGVSSFSQYAIGEASTALPVELVSLDGHTTENGVRLTWRTASETNNTGFRVEREAEAGGWTEVGFVESPVDGGTTTEAQSYAFTDEDIRHDADSLTYRLRQIDTDGSTNYSEPITVARSAVEHVQLLGTYPNPARSHATVRFAVPEGADAKASTLLVYDVLGRRVRSVRTPAEGGRHELTLDTSGLSSGMYMLRLQVGGRTKTQRMTVVE